MFLAWEKFILLAILLLPVVSTLLFHQNQIIKRISKISIIIIMLCISFISPIMLLINLKYWSLLVIALPFIFRGLGILLNKLDLSNFSSKINTDLITQLLIAAIGSLILIVLMIDYNLWSGLWLSLAIIIFSGTSIMPKIDRSRLLYGAVFGAISFIITPILSTQNALVTYFIVWLVFTIPYYYIPLIKKFIKYEIIPFILILIVTVIIVKNGGISFAWNKFYSTILFISILHIILYCIYYICNKYDNKLPNLIKQYYLLIVFIVLWTILTYYKNKFKNFNYIITNTLLILGLETMLIHIGRFFCPILYKFEKQIFIKIDDIYNIFILFFGKKTGNFLYKIIVGEHYNKLNNKETIIGTISTFIITFSCFWFASQNKAISIFIFNFLNNAPTYNMVSILFMILSGMTILDSVIKLLYHKKYNIGLDETESTNLSSIISVNYFLLLIYYLYTFLPYIKNINIYVKLIALLWVVLVSLTMGLSLFADLVKAKYNNLKYTRHYVSVLLYSSSVFIVIFSALTDSLQSLQTHHIINIFRKYYYIVVICTLLCKLVGFDTAIASKKMKNKHIRDTILLTLVIIFSGIPLFFLEAIILKISKSMAIAKFIINLIYLSFMLDWTKSIIIAIMPSKNSINSSWTDYLSGNNIKANIK